MDLKSEICMNCFKAIDDTQNNQGKCPYCGYDNNSEAVKMALEAGTILSEKYCLGRVLSANSEGFSYVAFNKDTQDKVVVREFFPRTMAYRYESSVYAVKDYEEEFEEYYSQFTDLATALTKTTGLTSLAKVLEIITENKTCYIVSEYYKNISLKKFVEAKGGSLNYNTFQDLFMPMINTLSKMHAMGIRHLGISPETLKVCSDGRLRLFDFSIEAVRRLGSSLQVDLINGCPAYEQYTKRMPCGEATDVYGFAASMFFTLTGRLPDGANKRVENARLLISREVLSQIPSHVVKALASALQVKPEDRTSSFESLKLDLLYEKEVEVEKKESRVITNVPQERRGRKKIFSIHPKVWLLLSFIVSVAILYNLYNYYMDDTLAFTDKIIEYLDTTLDVEVEKVTEVPDITGDYYKDWQELLKDTLTYQFKVEVVSEEFSDDYEEGIIISQSPEAGKDIVVGEAIEVVLSKGTFMRTLPTISGLSFEKATELLEAEGFVVVKVDSYSKDITAGYVLWYAGDYRTGDQLEYGSEVEVYVSTGS